MGNWETRCYSAHDASTVVAIKRGSFEECNALKNTLAMMDVVAWVAPTQATMI